MNLQKILLICAHPDDEVLGCGGLLSKFKNKSKIKVSKATAYRTLDLLVKYDFCRKMVLDDGIARYENKLDTEHHDHMICVDTGKIIEFVSPEIEKIQDEINEKLRSTYSKLNSWQKTQVARHEDSPRANFYINKIFSNFTLLSGDRLFADDKSIIAGFGLIDGKSVLILGQEKGDNLNTRLERNFGMMKPEGYRTVSYTHLTLPTKA